MLDWNEITERTQQRYVQKTGEIVSSVLNVISSTNAPHLWKALQTSNSMNEALGFTHQPSEKAYLEALAEAYKTADGWDTRRQVLSTMSDVASFNVISEYIPGLTQYRFTMANLHRLQYGRGAPVPMKNSPRLRISQQQLDHFLSFVTSPHLVQDLPFGQKELKMSSGKTITVPNVIRTMIPQRIVKQYSQYCEESDFKPFSESTMLRVLNECSATVRKSLQGLDNFAAQGARSFDDLATVVQTISPLKKDGEIWAAEMQESLKVGKLYLKGDYKVTIKIVIKAMDVLESFHTNLIARFYKQRCTSATKLLFQTIAICTPSVTRSIKIFSISANINTAKGVNSAKILMLR